MTAYLAGPMTGLPDFNYPAFHTAASRLRAAGMTVISPAEIYGADTTRSRAYYIREGIRALLDCDEIVLLPGWKRSDGARLEHEIARQTGLRITEYREGS